MPFPAMPTAVKCPQCDASFVVQVHTIIDIGEEPALKEQFLRGEINYAECPQCGNGGMLSTPIVYHDPSKELLVSYVPSTLQMGADQREQIVGGLVQAIMNSLPQEERKAYLLQPRTALTMESLFDTIWEADGISKAFLQERRSKLQLINELLAAREDEERLDQLVEEHRATLDYDFFLMIGESIDAYAEHGEKEHVEALEALRTALLDRVNPTSPIAPDGATTDDLIELLRNVQAGADWTRTIAMNRMRLDYGFFQALTSRIEAAQAANDSVTADELTTLRQRILDEIDAQSRAARESEDKASLLVMSLLEADDLEGAMREHLDEIDQVFLAVLSRYQVVAENQNDTKRAAKFGAMLETALNLLEEQLPPDIRLINRLTRTEYPEGTNQTLEENRGILSHAFLSTYDRMVEELEGRGDTEMAEHLRTVRPQIVAKIEIQRL